MFLKQYYKTLLSLLIIFVLCFLPGNAANKIQFFYFPHFDKLVHLGMYFIYSLLLFFDLRNNTQLHKKQIFFAIILSSLVIGGMIELIQNYFIPMRSGNWYDLLADLTGNFVFIVGISIKKN